MIQSVPFHLDPTLSPDMQQEQQLNARARAVAQALMVQGMTPSGPLAPGVKQSWLEPISKALQGGVGGYLQNKADLADQSIPRRAAADNAAAVTRYNTSVAGKPPPPDLQESDPMNRTTGGGINAIKDAMVDQNPMIRSLATRDYTAESLRLQHERDLAQKAQDKFLEAEHAKALKTDESVPENWAKDLPAKAKRGPLPGQYIGDDGDLMQMVFKDGKFVGSKNVNTLPKAVQDRGSPGSNAKEVADPDPKFPGRMLLVDLTKYKPGTSLGSAGVYGVAKSEAVQGGREAQRRFKSTGIGSALQQAEDLLMGNKRDSEGNVTQGNLPTGSGLGSAVDSVAGFFGGSPTGAAEAAELRVVGGVLVSKVPRFEGPQSDKDTAMYKQMAGDAANEKLPRDRRLAAVQKMRELYAGYETGTTGRLVGEPGQSDVRKSEPTWSPEKQKRLDELLKKQNGTK